MKKTLLTVGALTAIGASTVTGIGVANAATNTSSTDPTSTLVAKIADKFDLKQSDVQAVFDEQRTEMEADREQAQKERLAQAVKDGDITQAQADKITAKLVELKANREANKDKTGTERREAMQKEMNNLKSWAEQNNIDMKYLHMGGHGPHGHGPMTDDDSSQGN